MGKRKIYTIILIVVVCTLMSGCDKTEQEVSVSVESNLPESENKVVGSFDECFADYISKLGENYDYGISVAVVSNMLEEPNPEKVADYKELLMKEENSYLLDFTLPLMENLYVSKETGAANKEAARAFCKYVEENYGFEKLIELSKSSVKDEEKVKLKNDWLKEIGSEAEYTPAAPFFFIKSDDQYNKGRYPYYISGDSYDLYILLKDVKTIGYRDLFCDYTATADYWEADLKNAREIFFGEDKEVPRVAMYTRFTWELINAENVAGFYKNNEIVFLKSFYRATQDFTHEYTHHLQQDKISELGIGTIGYGEEEFTDEVKPRICALIEGYDVERDCYHYKRQAYTSTITKENINHPILWNEVDNAYDYGSRNDMFTLLYNRPGSEYFSVSYEVEETGPEIKPYYRLSYEQMGSLVHYLREIKGDEAVDDAFPDPGKFEALFDGDYEEVYKRWQEKLVEDLNEKGITEEYMREKFGE